MPLISPPLTQAEISQELERRFEGSGFLTFAPRWAEKQRKVLTEL